MKRYVLQANKSAIEDYFEISNGSQSGFEKDFNILPGAEVPIIISQNGSRKILNANWGLPAGMFGNDFYAVQQTVVLKDDKLKKLAETSACIIPASGFYKWKETVHDPLPFYLRVLSKEILPLAGIYTAVKDEKGNLTYSFAVITMPANALVEPLDKSMPCIVEPSDLNKWLGGGALKMLEKGFNGQYLLPDMAVYRVPDLVNNPENNSRELIQPIPKLREDDD